MYPKFGKPSTALRLLRQADLLTGLVFISYLGDEYQTQPQTWPGLGLRCLSDCCSLERSTTDIFVPWGLSVEATAKTTVNKLHVQQNRSRCLLTCLSLAFLKGRGKGGLTVADGKALHSLLYTFLMWWSNVKYSECTKLHFAITLKIHLAEWAFTLHELCFCKRCARIACFVFHCR